MKRGDLLLNTINFIAKLAITIDENSQKPVLNLIKTVSINVVAKL